MSYDTPQIIFWNAAPEMHRAHLERLRNQQRMLATDTPTTLLAVAMTHYELPGLGLDGLDLVQIDAPFRSYLTSARALLRARSLEGLVGNWDRSDGLPPVLRPRLASGLLRVPFRLVLGEGCGLALASAPFLARSRAWSGRQLTLEIRVLHVQSTQLALSRSTRSSSRTDCLQDLNMHCRIAGAAVFVQPLPQRQR